MSQGLVLEWLDENALRSYPLKVGVYTAGDVTLKNEYILDAKFVTISSTVISVIAVGVSLGVITIVTSLGDFVVNTPITSDYTVITLSNGQGKMVVGKAIAEMPDGFYFFNAPFEASTYVKATATAGWRGVTNLQLGTLGYTNQILGMGKQTQFIAANNTLTLNVGGNYGLSQESCLGDGDCNVAIKSINGAEADGDGKLDFVAGNGISIIPDPDNHRIWLGILSEKLEEYCPVLPPS